MTPTNKQLVAFGADGIAGGWMVAACHVDPRDWERAVAAKTLPPPRSRRVELHRCDTVADVARLRLGTQAVVAIDVPLGLPEHGGARPCDAAARQLLRSGASSVFNPPAPYLFAALAKPTAQERWHEVQRLVDERRAKYPDVTVTRVSQQTVGILDKVADANAYLRDNPEAQRWLVECHPEISFLRLNGGSRLASKSSAAGALNRLELIEREFPSAREGLREHPLGRTIPLADLLDAYAALWTALRVASGVMDPSRDALGVAPDGHSPQADGVAMRIVA